MNNIVQITAGKAMKSLREWLQKCKNPMLHRNYRIDVDWRMRDSSPIAGVAGAILG